MSVGVDARPRLAASRPRPLLEWPSFQGELGRTYDVSRPDGERFLDISNAGSATGATRQEPSVEIVLNWSDVLDERVPRQR